MFSITILAVELFPTKSVAVIVSFAFSTYSFVNVLVSTFTQPSIS